MLAKLYTSTNGTANSSQIANLLGASIENVEKISTVFGETTNSTENAQLFQQTVLWGASKLSALPQFPAEVGYLALGLIFISISIITTVLRLYQRSRTPMGLQIVVCMVFTWRSIILSVK